MGQVVLITGGNLGPVAENLNLARESIARMIGPVYACSSFRASEAWGFEAKESFLNQILVVDTPLNPEQVLTCCQQIEFDMGRRRTSDGAYHSRTMDIDILFYDDRIVRTDRLTIPHPHLQRRDFVLAPLEEVLPDYIHPLFAKSVHQLRCELLASQQEVAAAQPGE